MSTNAKIDFGYHIAGHDGENGGGFYTVERNDAQLENLFTGSRYDTQALASAAIDEGERGVIADEMMKTGGSFVQALGKALSRADITNARRIKATWPEFWDEYLKRSNESEAAILQRD
jgi:hypothetical protein